MSVRARVRKHDNGAYVGTITIASPNCGGVGDTGGDGVITIGAFGDSKADALHKAALVAERITSDPVLRAIIPPQALLAVAATKKLASAAKGGARLFRSVWKRFKGPGVQRLARALHDESMKRDGATTAEVGAFWGRVKKLAKKAVKYGTVPGLVYTAARYAGKKTGVERAIRKKLGGKKARRRELSPETVYADQPPPGTAPEDMPYEAAPEYQDPPPMPEYEAAPEAAPEYADPYADNGDDAYSEPDADPYADVDNGGDE